MILKKILYGLKGEIQKPKDKTFQGLWFLDSLAFLPLISVILNQ